MTSIHSTDLKDSDRNMYVFPRALVTDELIDALKTHYVNRDCKEYATYQNDIKLVPSNPYFLCYEYHRRWFYKQRIIITKEQLDKYLLLFNINSINFLDYIELVLEGDKL